MSPPSPTTEPQTPGLVASMFRYWRVSLIIVVVAAVATYGVSLTAPKKYQATASVELIDPGSGSVFQTNATLPDDFERFTLRQAIVLKSASVATEVAKTVKGLSLTEYSRDVKVSATTPGLLVVKARAATARKAVQLANATVSGYRKVTAASTNKATNAALGAITSSIVALTGDFDRVNKQLQAKPNDPLLQANLQGLIANRGALLSRASELQVNKNAFGDGVSFLDPARLPKEPVQPQPLRNAGIAALLALLAAAVLAWIRADRHQAADDSAAPAAILDAPMLGTIPVLGRDEDMAAVSDGSSAAAEAYQYVAASLEHLFKWGILLVTSPSLGDGKTVSAASIAAAAARDGTRVMLVDADGRASTLTSRLLGASQHRSIGLTDLAVGAAELDDAFRLLPLDDGVVLPFIPAGSHEGNGGLFRTAGMARLFEKLRESYDLVVVDTAALLAVADVASLATHADGIVGVVKRGTPLASLESVRQRLDLVGAPLVGYVFTFAEEEAEPYLQPAATSHQADGRRRRPGRKRRTEGWDRPFGNGKGNGNGRRRTLTGAPSSPEGNGVSEHVPPPHQVDDRR